MNTIKLAKNYIDKQGYRILECSGENIVFRYQLENISIWNDKDANFLMMVLTIDDDIDDDDKDKFFSFCNSVNSEIKMAKVYVTNDCVIATIEVYYANKKEFENQIGRALGHLVTAKWKFEKLQHGIEI